MIQPMLGIRPEALDTINVITAFGSAFFLANHNVIATNIKERISVPVIGILKTARLSVIGHKRY